MTETGFVNQCGFDELSEPCWEVVILGAGPAGAMLAHTLARGGRRVLLVDRASFPRRKVCGGCLNQAALSALTLAGLDHLVQKAGGRRYDRIRLAAGRHQCELELPAGMSVSRGPFDLALLEAARDAGAVVQTATQARIEPINHATCTYRTVSLSSDGEKVTINAPIVVDATGLSGSASQPGWSIQRHARLGIGTIAPANSADPHDYPAGAIHMICGKQGYLGLVRVEHHQLDIAAAVDHEFLRECGSPAAAATEILRQAAQPPLGNLDQLTWKGTATLTRQRVILGEPRLFFVGDATGYVEPFTGEGMAWAMNSAQLLAPILVDTLRDGWSAGQLQRWVSEHRRSIRRRQRLCRLVAMLMRHPHLTQLGIVTLAHLPFLNRPLAATLNAPIASHAS